MPGGSKYEGPPEALDAYRSAVEGSKSGTEVKGAKNPIPRVMVTCSASSTRREQWLFVSRRS